MTATDTAVGGRARAEAAIAEVFAAVGAAAAVHAMNLDSGAAIGLDPDAPVVSASVFKVPIMVAYAEDAVVGRIDPAERVTVTDEHRVPGGTGLSIHADPVELSLRDAALLMMTVSCNTSCDLILGRVGLDRVNRKLTELGLAGTRLTGDCRHLLTSLIDELGPAALDPDTRLADLDPGLLGRLSVLDPARTSRTTARDMTTLLAGVWQDRAAPPAACAEVRHAMQLQIWPHRIASGLSDRYRWAGKTGTLPGVRNEVGVVVRPDGARVAVAVFTRTSDYADNRPNIDRAIGAAARIAVDALP